MSRFLNVFLQRKVAIKMLILGLEQAGKTTFLNRLKLDKFTTPLHTMGVNYDQVEFGSLFMNVWDLGGQKTFRETIWSKLLEIGDIDILLWVIDSSDHDRLSESEEELIKILANPRIENTPCAILANKQDLDNAMDLKEIMIHFKIVESCIKRSFQIFPTSMLTSAGIDSVLQWIHHIATKET